MNQRDLIRIPIILVVMGINAVLSHYAFRASVGSPVLNSMRVASYVVILMALVLACQSLACGLPMQKHSLRLTMETVLVHVYGLGLLIFVSVYCLLGVSGDASATFFAVTTCIALQDIVVRTKDTRLRRGVLFFSALLAGVANVVAAAQMPGAGEGSRAFDQHRWFIVMFGIVVPFGGPCVYFAIRGKRFYNPVTVYDFLNFGMPFAVIIAFMILVGHDLFQEDRDSPTSLSSLDGWAEAVGLTNLTGLANLTGSLLGLAGNASDADGAAAARLVAAADLAVPLLALNMIPTVFLAIQSTLLYSTVDFLAAAGVAAAFRALWEDPQGPLTAVAFVAAAVAFSLRIYACFRDEGDRCSVAYTRESEDDEEDQEVLAKLQEEAIMAEV